MTDTGTKIHLSLKDYNRNLRQTARDALTGRYEPLNPATFGKPAPAPLPFMSINPRVREWVAPKPARPFMTFDECALVDGKWRWFIRSGCGVPVSFADDFVSAREKLLEASLPTPVSWNTGALKGLESCPF